MLIDFFFTLKDAKIPVTIKEFLTLLEAMQKNVIDTSLDDFYYLSRLTMVKDEAHFDKFDRAFGMYFKGVNDVFLHRLQQGEEFLDGDGDFRVLQREEEIDQHGRGRS